MMSQLWMLLVVALARLVYGGEDPASGLTITATRSIDITTQIVKSTTEYTIKNAGSSSVSSFLHAVDAADAQKLSWISANAEKKDGPKLKVKQVQVNGAPKGLVHYKIDFVSPLAAGASQIVLVKTQVTQSLKPHPSKISQSENQYVVFSGSAHISAPYAIEKETTNVKFGSGTLIVYTAVEPSKHATTAVTYGPYNNVAAHSIKPVTVHYENNSPFLVVSSLERWIEISHWGNIAVEEKITVEHRGAQLMGEFSRLDYQMDRRGNRQPAVKSFKTHLPVSARDIYYRDQIGNISTSTVSKKANRVEVELRPRFPLFGGWKTDYVLGYNVPAVGFLHNKGSDYALKIPFIDHIFDNVVIEKAVVKIVLPEASSNIKLVNPYDLTRKPDQVHKTYLDTVGRPVIVLEKENLVDSHSIPITVYYEFERFMLLREPVIAVGAFFVVFVAVIVISRCDFSIRPKSEVHQKKE